MIFTGSRVTFPIIFKNSFVRTRSNLSLCVIRFVSRWHNMILHSKTVRSTREFLLLTIFIHLHSNIEISNTYVLNIWTICMHQESFKFLNDTGRLYMKLNSVLLLAFFIQIVMLSNWKHVRKLTLSLSNTSHKQYQRLHLCRL